jgi:iron complex outermembrane receptor protein
MRDWKLKSRSSSAAAFGATLLTLASSVGLAQETAPAAAADLEEVVVEARYLRDVAEGAGPLKLDVVDTPQAIGFVTRELIDDTAATNLEEIIERVSGTQKGFEITGVYRSSLLRGFFAVNMDSYKEDGLTFINQIDTDLASIDRIEVIKGPASVLYGRSVPGGIINRVTKKPLEKSAHEFSIEGATDSQFRAEFDSTGPLRDGRVRYRVVGALEDRGSHIDLVESERQYLQGTLDFDIGSASMLRIRGSVQQDEGRGDTGLPLVYSADRRQALVPNIDPGKAFSFGNGRFEVDAWDASAQFTTQFDNGWRVLVRGDRREYTRLIVDGYVFNFEPITVQDIDDVVLDDVNGDPLASLDGQPIGRFLFPTAGEIVGLSEAYISRDDLKNEVTNLEANIARDVELFGRSHTVVFGATYTDLTLNSGGVFPGFAVNTDPRLGFGASVAVDIFSTDIGALRIPEEAFQGIARTPIIQGEYLSLFAQAAWRPTDRLTVVTSLAWNKAEGQGSSPENRSDYDRVNPQLGVVFELTDDVNVYASYSRGTLNNDAFDRFGNPLAPIEGDQFELGVKGSFFDDQLLATLALFDLTRSNAARSDPACFPTPSDPDPCAPFSGASVAAGEQQHRGIEVDIVGNPIRNLSVIFSATLLDPEVTSDPSDPSLVGTRPRALSKFTGSLFANFEFTSGALAGLSIGGGPVHIGDRVGLAFGDPTVRVPGYTRWDAVVGYQVNDRFALSLNLDNIGDIENRIRTYPDTYGNLRVTPFSVTARAAYKW